MTFDDLEFETVLADARELARAESLEFQAAHWGDTLLHGDLG